MRGFCFIKAKEAPTDGVVQILWNITCSTSRSTGTRGNEVQYNEE